LGSGPSIQQNDGRAFGAANNLPDKSDSHRLVRFGFGLRLRRQLQDARRVTFAQQRQQDDLSIEEFEGVVMRGELPFVNLISAQLRPSNPKRCVPNAYRLSHRRHHGNEYGPRPQIVWKDRGVDSFPLVHQRVLRRGRVPQLRNAHLYKTDIVAGVPQSQNGFKFVDRLPLHSTCATDARSQKEGN
jgi:hypothetical protein